MKRHGSRVFLGIAVCAALLAGKSVGQEGADDEVEIVRGEPIDAGYVILDGRYLPPPYVLEKRGDDLWVNDQLATAGWFAGLRGVMGPRGRGGPRGDRRYREGPGSHGPRGRRTPSSEPRDGLSQIESTLGSNGTLIAGEELRGCSLHESRAASIVDILMSEDSPEEKLVGIQGYDQSGMGQSSWERVIATFVPSAELMERMGPEIELNRKVAQDNESKHKAALASAFWTSKPMKYVITLLAMGLVVAACGTLLNYRPTGRARWSQVDTTGDGVPIVVRSVLLLILLGIFDLGCTLVAQQAGGFTEMNPLGERIVGNPLFLTAFKLTSLLLACSILFALRRYRGAQVASWWMCLLCTVLTFRWLTYNSLYMS